MRLPEVSISNFREVKGNVAWVKVLVADVWDDTRSAPQERYFKISSIALTCSTLPNSRCVCGVVVGFFLGLCHYSKIVGKMKRFLKEACVYKMYTREYARGIALRGHAHWVAKRQVSALAFSSHFSAPINSTGNRSYLFTDCPRLQNRESDGPSQFPATAGTRALKCGSVKPDSWLHVNAHELLLL